MNISSRVLVLSIALTGLSTSSYAQSGSFGGGTSGPSGPNSVEESFFGVSYSSQASACARAKSEAVDAGRKRSNVRDTSLGSCSCSSTKKKLWVPHAQAQYSTETGSSDYTSPVDVYECTVDARLSFNR